MIVAEALVALADLPGRLAAFLGDERPERAEQARAHVTTVTALARSYTRRRGFTAGFVEEPVAAVITTAAARSLASPGAVARREVGSISELFTPFLGWSLVELAVLNGYRRTAA